MIEKIKKCEEQADKIFEKVKDAKRKLASFQKGKTKNNNKLLTMEEKWDLNSGSKEMVD